MIDALDAFLASDEQKPWTPGREVDCCLSLANWAMWLGHPDPAAHLRGTYEPGQGQIEILARSGGAMALVEHCARSIGGVRIDRPGRGDIGVVGSSTNPTRQFGVIHSGQFWITRTSSGWVRVTAKTLAAWKITDGH